MLVPVKVYTLCKDKWGNKEHRPQCFARPLPCNREDYTECEMKSFVRILIGETAKCQILLYLWEEVAGICLL